MHSSKRWYYIAGYNLAIEAAFKNCEPLTKCITKIDETAIDNVENLDLVVHMYNLIEYSSDYLETTGRLLFYSKNEATEFNNNIVNTNDFKSFKYNTKLLGNLETDGANGILKNETIGVTSIYIYIYIYIYI